MVMGEWQMRFPANAVLFWRAITLQYKIIPESGEAG
jgi:hypothetical protein